MFLLYRLVIVALIVFGWTVWCDDYPGVLENENYSWQLLNRPLLNLTMLLLKDCHLKLRMADLIQEQYKHSIAYELGLLASGIMDKFRHMLKTYRRFTDLKNFKNRKYTFKIMLNGYHAMLSDYHQLRLERDIYMGIYEKHVSTQLKDPQSQQIMQMQKQYGIDPSTIEQLKKQGFKGRRSMNITNNVNFNVTAKKLTINKLMSVIARLKKNKKTGTGEKMNWKKDFDAEEEEYKKKLRYIKWAEGWRGYKPEIEGVSIPEHIANLGLVNTSSFLAKELKGLF